MCSYYEVFSFLTSNLKQSIKSWNYFVNWEKVKNNCGKIERELHLLNSIIGKTDIAKEAKALIEEYPTIIKTIPFLLAIRGDSETLLLKDGKGYKLSHYEFTPSMSAEKSVEFLKGSGILDIFQNRAIKSIPDYVFGVEAGLDSNARKNRSGSSMERIVEEFVFELCHRKNAEYITQATKQKIIEKWGREITVNKANRSIDFAIRFNDKLFLIETNFYGGGGSKLKSTAGEYKSDYRQWSKDHAHFIWITDGLGWSTALNPLRETFEEIDYIINLSMLERGVLDYVIV